MESAHVAQLEQQAKIKKAVGVREQMSALKSKSWLVMNTYESTAKKKGVSRGKKLAVEELLNYFYRIRLHSQLPCGTS